MLRLEFTGTGSPVLPVALLIVGTNGSSRCSCPTPRRVFRCASAAGRRDGRGLHQGRRHVAQFLAILALVPPLDVVSLIIIVPTVGALVLVAVFGKETSGRDLRDLDPDGRTFAATGV